MNQCRSQLSAVIVNFKSTAWLFSRFPAKLTRFIMIGARGIVPR